MEAAQAARPGARRSSGPARSLWAGSAPRGRPGLGAAVRTEACLAVRFPSLEGAEVRWSSGGLRSARGGPGPV